VRLTWVRSRWAIDKSSLYFNIKGNAYRLLTLLIEDFEEKHYKLPKGKPLDVLRFLIEQHNLLQKDLADVFGTPSIVSEVLNGKRELNKAQIARLSARFHVSPELFF